MTEFEIVYNLRYHIQDMDGGEKYLTKKDKDMIYHYTNITEEGKKTIYFYDDGKWYWHPTLFKIS
jgi:hypothetical protein